MRLLDALAKVGLAIVILYLLGKVLGIINSPWQLDVLAIISGGFFVWRYATNIEEIHKDLHFLKRRCPEFKGEGCEREDG